MAELEIIVTDEGDHGAYRANVEGSDRQAELTWRSVARGDGDVRNANHTFTPPEARGKGIALKLVESMIADAREQEFKIVPGCPYVAAQFDKHPDWADLRA
ncbi:GNAT family N-acetyltransferase [Aurantiacibacter sp. MUD61]|uniref:GNAT family N-acetyltransferase n=1 Tax=Aurantiacibacter sp. MUD61 TaxID=3009083 RepID=UPI0022F01A41|nr:GNAT family N-acetyltransferase [Aurantiacibacter sp. MUD61]